MSTVLMTIRQAAEATALGEPIIRKAINEGSLRAKNVGNPNSTRPTIRIKPEDLNEWVDSLADVIS